MELARRKSLSCFCPLSETDTIFAQLEGSYEAFFERFPRPIEVRNGGDQWWHHEPGNEFLVANPIEIPGLQVLLGSDFRKTSMVDGKETPFDLSLGVFTWTYKGDDDPYEKYHHTPPPTKQKPDLFSKLPAELLSTIIEPLSSKDIANLRLATPAFRQLPISLFRGLLLREMPWLWGMSPPILVILKCALRN